MPNSLFLVEKSHVQVAQYISAVYSNKHRKYYIRGGEGAASNRGGTHIPYTLILSHFQNRKGFSVYA